MTLDQLIEKLQQLRNNVNSPIPTNGSEKVVYQKYLGDISVEITQVFFSRHFNENVELITNVTLS